MKEKLIAFADLVDLNHSLPVMVFSTLLGAATTQVSFSWSIVIILLANILALWVNFILRNLVFAPLDISEQRVQTKNPIAAGIFNTKIATIFLLVFTLIAITLYASISSSAFITGMVLLADIGLLHWRRLGLQNAFYLRTGPYHWLLNAFFCLLGSLCFGTKPNQTILLAIAFVLATCIHIYLLDELRNPNTQYRIHRLNLASMISLALSALLGVGLFIVLRLLPYWILGLFVVLVAIMALPQLINRHHEKQKFLFRPGVLRIALLRSAAISLAVHFIVPLIYQLFKK